MQPERGTVWKYSNPGTGMDCLMAPFCKHTKNLRALMMPDSQVSLDKHTYRRLLGTAHSELTSYQPSCDTTRPLRTRSVCAPFMQGAIHHARSNPPCQTSQGRLRAAQKTQKSPLPTCMGTTKARNPCPLKVAIPPFRHPGPWEGLCQQRSCSQRQGAWDTPGTRIAKTLPSQSCQSTLLACWSLEGLCTAARLQPVAEASDITVTLS